jgi:hypothetical protein
VPDLGGSSARGRASRSGRGPRRMRRTTAGSLEPFTRTATMKKQPPQVSEVHGRLLVGAGLLTNRRQEMVQVGSWSSKLQQASWHPG